MDRRIILNCLSIETAHFMDRQQLTHMLSMKLSEFMDRGRFYIGEMGLQASQLANTPSQLLEEGYASST